MLTFLIKVEVTLRTDNMKNLLITTILFATILTVGCGEMPGHDNSGYTVICRDMTGKERIVTRNADLVGTGDGVLKFRVDGKRQLTTEMCTATEN